MDEKIEFIRNEALSLLRETDPSTKQLWGSMSFQHMIEHLSLSLRMANGKFKVEEIASPEEKIISLQKFLHSDKPFTKGIKAPSPYPKNLPELRFQTIEEAIDRLEQEIDDFFDYFEANPEAKLTNPVFGVLDYEHWILFNNKHFEHHLRQFGLVD